MKSSIWVIALIMVLLVTFVSILSMHESYSTISQDDIYVLEDGAKYMKDISNFMKSCYLKSNNNPEVLADCTLVTSAFNLKMDELKEEYGTVINETIKK